MELVEKRQSLSLLPAFSLSLSLSCHMSAKRTEIEDGGGKRETDKRMVLILESLCPPSYLIQAPFHYRDEPQSFVQKVFAPFPISFILSRYSRALVVTIFFLSRMIISH